MKDRLRKDYDDIENLGDIIDARDEHRNWFNEDIDSLEEDIEVPDVDPDDALTFPHPKRKHPEQKDTSAYDREAMSVEEEEEISFDFEDSVEEMLPTDYMEHYEYATDTMTTDDERDEIVQERIDDLGEVDADDLSFNVPVRETPEVGHFNAEEAEDEERKSTGG